MDKKEREERIDSLVGCSNVSRWIDGKSDEKISQIPEEIRALLFGHISKCSTCGGIYRDKLPFLGDE